jgi:hypothetical protein
MFPNGISGLIDQPSQAKNTRIIYGVERVKNTN